MIAHPSLPIAHHFAASFIPRLLQNQHLQVTRNPAMYLAVSIEANHNLEIVPIIHGILTCNPEVARVLRLGWHFQQGKLLCLDGGLKHLPLSHRVRLALRILRAQDVLRDELDAPMLLVGFVGCSGERRCLKAEFDPISDSPAGHRVRVSNRDKGRTFVPLTLEVPQLGRRNAPPLALAPIAPGPNVHQGVSLGQELDQPAPCIEPTMDGERHFSVGFDQGGKP